MVWMKRCRKCNKIKPGSDFSVDRSKDDGINIYCKICSSKAQTERRRAAPEKMRQYKRDYRGRYPKRTTAAEMRSSAAKRAKKRGMQFDIRTSWIKTKLDAGVCEVSGLPFSLGVSTRANSTSEWDSPSLDRIDNSKGYTRDNVRVVLWAVNAMAGTWGLDRALEITKAIEKKRKLTKK